MRATKEVFGAITGVVCCPSLSSLGPRHRNFLARSRSESPLRWVRFLISILVASACPSTINGPDEKGVFLARVFHYSGIIQAEAVKRVSCQGFGSRESTQHLSLCPPRLAKRPRREGSSPRSPARPCRQLARDRNEQPGKLLRMKR